MCTSRPMTNARTTIILPAMYSHSQAEQSAIALMQLECFGGEPGTGDEIAPRDGEGLGRSGGAARPHGKRPLVQAQVRQERFEIALRARAAGKRMQAPWPCAGLLLPRRWSRR